MAPRRVPLKPVAADISLAIVAEQAWTGSRLASLREREIKQEQTYSASRQSRRNQPFLTPRLRKEMGEGWGADGGEEGGGGRFIRFDSKL